MDFFNMYAVLTATLAAVVLGFIWYHPKVFGTAWMQAAGLSEEQMKGGNMAKIFSLALLFAFLLATAIPGIVVHQMGALALTGGDSSLALQSYSDFMSDYGNNFRTFKHGALHGAMSGIFIALPILGTNALFERKSAKYIAIHAGYWIVTLGVMGGIIGVWR